MKILEMEQGTPEWFEARRGVVTSSKFKDVMTKGRGDAPSKTRLTYMKELACEQITGVVQDSFSSEWMERGNELEPRARANFALERGVEVTEVGFILMDDGLVGSSTDGLVDANGVLEIKCPKHTTHFDYLGDNSLLVKAYNTQLQGELWVTEREVGYLVAYHPDFPEGQDIIIVEVARDEAFIDEMSTQIEIFLEDLGEMIKRAGGAA